MSESDRNGDIARGLIAGISIGVLVCVFAALTPVTSSEAISGATDHPYQSAYNSHQCGDGNKPVWGPLFGACFGLFDTVAQWMMMVFTIIAAVLLYGTLRSANRTNLAAVNATKAAERTNKIMLQEQRPWITLRRDADCDFFERGWGCSIAWNFYWENLGKSPAHDIRMRSKAIKVNHLQGLREQLNAFVDFEQANRDITDSAVIFPSERTEHCRYSGSIRTSYNRQKRNESGEYTILMICITYRLGVDKKSEIGAEGTVMGVVPKENFYGPFGHKMLEYASLRVIR